MSLAPSPTSNLVAGKEKAKMPGPQLRLRPGMAMTGTELTDAYLDLIGSDGSPSSLDIDE